MNWESFDWTTLLWIGGIILLIGFMMWGCGGMMRGGGCCGMGGRQQGQGYGPGREAGRRLIGQKGLIGRREGVES